MTDCDSTEALRPDPREVSSSEGRRIQLLAAGRRISADAAARRPAALRDVDHGDLLYGEKGLPR